MGSGLACSIQYEPKSDRSETNTSTRHARWHCLGTCRMPYRQHCTLYFGLVGRISWVERRCAMGIRVASGTGQWGVGWTAAGSVPSSESPEEVPHAARRRRWLLALAASAKSFRQTWTSTSGAFQVDGRRARREAVPVSTSHEPRQGKGPAHFLTSLFRVLTSYRS
jgi:hypothetical protein